MTVTQKDPNNTITNTESFKFKGKITERTPATSNIKDSEKAALE